MKSYEIEYSNLDLRFDRRQVRDFISNLIEEGYSLYWNENESHFIIAIRSGRKLLKLKFERIHDKYKMVGSYAMKDLKLAELLEKMINHTRGHAVVKRFSDEQILIENIMFGEVIRTVEINGVEHKVLFQKQLEVTNDAIEIALASNRIEERIPQLRKELDEALDRLQTSIQMKDVAEIEVCKTRLEQLRIEMLLVEL